MTSKQIEQLKKLIHTNSYTWSPEGVNNVAAIIQEMCRDLPLDWEITPSQSGKKGNLYAARSTKIDPKRPIILLSGHIDTVFKENWPDKIEGDRFYAPGGMDMKAGVLVMIEILHKLHDSDNLENIIMLLTPDEEDGMEHIQKQGEYYRQADFALIFEEGTLNQANPTIKERAMVVARKALSFFEIRTYGSAGHNAKFVSKETRNSAILEMAKIILLLESLADYEKGTLLNPGIINGGGAANMLAAESYIKVDTRYGNRYEVERVREIVLEKLPALYKGDASKSDIEIFTKLNFSANKNIKIDVKEVLFYPSFDPAEENEKLAEKLIDLGRKSGLTIQKQYRSSGSEANWISHLNPECVVLDGFGVIGTGDHSQEEYFLIDSFQSSIDFALETIDLINLEYSR